MIAYATREEAIAAFATEFMRAAAVRASMTPRAAAEAAWYPGHPLGSIEAIEAKIRARRAEQAAEQQIPQATAA